MQHRRWDAKTKAKIVMEGLENKIPMAELCNHYQISQSMYYRWLDELRKKASQAFEPDSRRIRKERKLMLENRELKRVIAELSIELKKTELELKELDQ